MNNSALHLLHTWQLLNDARKSCKNSNYMLHFARKNCLSLKKYPTPPAMSTTPPRMKLIVVPQNLTTKIQHLSLDFSELGMMGSPGFDTLGAGGDLSDLTGAYSPNAKSMLSDPRSKYSQRLV